MVAPRSRVTSRSTGLFCIRFFFQFPQNAPGIQVPALQLIDWSKTEYSMWVQFSLCYLNRSWSKPLDRLCLAVISKKRNKRLNKKVIQDFFSGFRQVYYVILKKDLCTKLISGDLHLRLPTCISSFSWLTCSLISEKSETWYCCHSKVGLRLGGAWTHPANFYNHINVRHLLDCCQCAILLESTYSFNVASRKFHTWGIYIGHHYVCTLSGFYPRILISF